MFRTLRPVDLVVVSIVFLGAITATLQICGAHDPMAMFALIVGWTWPATRGIARWRSQGSPRRGVSLDGHLITITLAALGAAWWFALPVVVQLRSGALLAPLALPRALRWCGLLLTLYGLQQPTWRAGRRTGVDVDAIRESGMILGVGLFLASASPLVGVLVAPCLALGLASAPPLGEFVCLQADSLGSVQDQKEVHRSNDLLVESMRDRGRIAHCNSFTERRLLVLPIHTSPRGSTIAQLHLRRVACRILARSGSHFFSPQEAVTDEDVVSSVRS